MQNLQTNEALLQHFQVEELEERLENKWGNSTTKSCPVAITFKDGLIVSTTVQGGFPTGQACPPPRVTYSDTGEEGWGESFEVDEE